MLNPFFLQGSKGEQSLVQDLINEQLKIYGVEVYYLPREYVTEKTVIKEVVESQFTNAFPIEAYVDTYDGYGGQGTLLSKFGIQDVDDLTLIVSKERYEDYIYPLAKDIPNVKLASRPKEGDLIYFPLGDKLFEIKYVEHEKPFYQLQKNYVYELKCELYRYQDELIDTEVDFIDDSMESEGYIQTLQLVGIGSTATAITNIVDGGVRYVSVTKRGSSYTSTPTVAFSSSPAITAVGFATMIKGIVDLCEVSPDLSRVQSVNLSNSGAGYTVAPMVTFIGGGGSGAEATSYIGDGVVGIVTITSGGGGYVSAPLVTFESPIGPGAAATVTVSAAGTVTAVTIDNGGAHYNPSSPPTVTFSTPLDRINGVTSLIPSSTLPKGSNFTSGVYTTNNVSLGSTGTGLTLDVTVNESGAVTAAEIADPGQHYANGNVVTITNGLGGASGTVSFSVVTAENIDGVTATGVASVSSAGIVTSISITNAGVGYYSGATVSIANTVGDKVFGSGLVVATGKALVSAAGIITSIHITNAGLGYTQTPTITISAPQSVTGVGTYVYNEEIVGSDSGTKARVRSWNTITNILEVSNLTGSFTAGETLVGQESGAEYSVRIVNTDNLADSGDSDNLAGNYEDNFNIETEADSILDFSETNPFGTP